MDDDKDNSEARFRQKYEGRIKDVRLDTLPAFIAEMLADEMDYGTICLAIGFAGAAAAWATEKSPQGGITGFQAGFIGWELLRQWGAPDIGKTGARLINYDDLLYPQYEDKFRAVSATTWARVRERAAELLTGNTEFTAPSVLAHWKSVAAGNVPFGLAIEGTPE